MFISSEISVVPCSNCGGDVIEFSVPNHIWNEIVRSNDKETDNEYLCVWCFISYLFVWFEKINGKLD